MLTNHSLPLGTRVRLKVLIALSSGAALVMQAKGQIVRVESDQRFEQTNGFAVATKTFTVRNKQADILLQSTQKNEGLGISRGKMKKTSIGQ